VSDREPGPGTATPTAEDSSEPEPRIVRIGGARFNTTVAVMMVAAVTLWRTWAVLQWSFVGDDWVLISEAARVPFLEFVTAPYEGHFMPGVSAIVWLLTRMAPLHHGFAVLPGLVVTFAAGLVFWLLLLELFGNRPANLVPLAIFLLCPLVLRPAFSVVAGLMTLTLELALVAMMLLVLRYVRRPSALRLVGLGFAYLLALLLWEKALLVLPLVVMFVLFYLGQGAGWDRIRSVTVGRWPLWAVLLGVTAVYVPTFVAVGGWLIEGSTTPTLLGRLVATTLGSSVVPSYLGGPWDVSVTAPDTLRELSGAASLATSAMFLAVVGVSLVARRQAWRAWTMLAVYVGMCIAILAAGRLSTIGPVAGLDTRSVADSVPVFALAVALAYMVPVDRRGDAAWSDRYLVMDRPAGRQVSAPEQQRKQVIRLVSNVDAPLLVLLLIVAYGASSMTTAVRTASLASTSSRTKEWLANARTGLAEHPGAAVLDTFFPPETIPVGSFADGGRASSVLAPISRTTRWNAPGDRLFLFDEDGRLRPAVVNERTRLEAPSGCVIAVSGGVDDATFEESLPAWEWGIHLAYTADGPTPGAVRIGASPPQVVRFDEGTHDLILVHRGPVEAVTVHSADERVCVTEIGAGRLIPLNQ
jgi:hypothetical protein